MQLQDVFSLPDWPIAFGPLARVGALLLAAILAGEAARRLHLPLPGSRLVELFGEQCQGRVTSIHHQPVKHLGNGLVVEARSPADGVIEAIRWIGSSFVVGLQWDPEFHTPLGSELLDSGPIMQAFQEEVRRRREAAASATACPGGGRLAVIR